MLWVGIDAFAEAANSFFLNALGAIRAVGNWVLVWVLHFLSDHVVFLRQGAVVVAAINTFGLAVFAPLSYRLVFYV